MNAQCVQCQSAATYVFNWSISMGQQRAPLCSAHAAWWWWSTYRNTDAGTSLTIENIEDTHTHEHQVRRSFRHHGV